MAKNGKKPFFTTLPGILTGIAAVITAVTGLYVALRGPSETIVAPQPKEVSSKCSISGLLFDSDKNKPLSGASIDLYRDLRSIQQRPKKLKAGVATTGPDGKFSINCSWVEESQYPLLIAVRHRDWRATRITGPSIERSGEWDGIRIPIPMSEIEPKSLREVEVSFSSRKLNSDRFLMGEIENKSGRSFPCVRVRFNTMTSYQDQVEGEQKRHLGFVDVEVLNLKPHEKRSYQKKLPDRVGISLHSKEECQ